MLGGGGQSCRLAAEQPGQRRQQDEDEDHDQILDHQPADGDASVDRIEDAARFQSAQQDDGAGDRQGEAEDQRGARFPAPEHGQAQAHGGGDGDLDDGAGNGDTLDRQQVVQ